MNESILGILALKRGFRVIIYGLSTKANRTFLKLGGKMVTRRASKGLILKILELGIPPIVRIRSTKVYMEETQKPLPHYVVVKGVNKDGSFKVVDPWYDKTIAREYWDSWSDSIISIEKKH